MLFWKTLLAHVLTEFVFQPDTVAAQKEKPKTLFLHGLIFFLTSMAILLPGISYPIILALAFLAFFHGVVDFLKNQLRQYLRKEHWLIFLGDQALHIFAITAFAYYFDEQYLLSWSEVLSAYWSSPTTMMFASFFVLIVFGGGFFTGILCKGFLDRFDSKKKPGLERAGRTIGILERSLILMAVLFGRIEFIGYIFAAKSIARYPEMKDGDHFSEYYLVGTLTSISIAFFGGLWLKYLLGW
jgi:hypothetical protein